MECWLCSLFGGIGDWWMNYCFVFDVCLIGRCWNFWCWVLWLWWVWVVWNWLEDSLWVFMGWVLSEFFERWLVGWNFVLWCDDVGFLWSVDGSFFGCDYLGKDWVFYW